MVPFPVLITVLAIKFNLECAVKCTLAYDCCGYSFNHAIEQCRLSRSCLFSEDIVEAKEGWNTMTRSNGKHHWGCCLVTSSISPYTHSLLNHKSLSFPPSLFLFLLRVISSTQLSRILQFSL